MEAEGHSGNDLSSTPAWKKFGYLDSFSKSQTLGGRRLPRPPPSPLEEKYRFQTPDKEGENIFTMADGGGIRAATFEKLVEHLTHPQYPRPEFTRTFLLTYRTFTTPLKLLNSLVARYHTQPAEYTTVEKWEESAQTPIRLRVINVLRYWLHHESADFLENEKLCKNLIRFLKEDIRPSMPSAATSLQKLFDRQMSESDKNLDIVWSSKAPKMILPKPMPQGAFHLTNFHAEEIARQLTIIESKYFRSMKTREFLNQAWTKKDKHKKAPNIMAVIERFNAVSNYFAWEILLVKSLRERIALVKHIIDIAGKCLALNNFYTLMMILSGLGASAVHRLQWTWSGVDSKHTRMLEEFHDVLNRQQNFKNLREHLKRVNPPVIPYLGFYLTDLVFIEDGNGDHWPTKGVINFVKRQLVAQVISTIHQYQNTPYALEPCEPMQQWLLHISGVPDEDQMHEASLQIEPRDGTLPSDSLRKRKLKRSTEAPVRSPYGEMESRPDYPFLEPDTEENIRIVEAQHKKTTVMEATLPKLVERLTYETYPDPDYVMAFLMTYRTFTGASSLLDLLLERYDMPQPKDPSKDQLRRFEQDRKIPIHFRVANVLKQWTDHFLGDFREDTVLTQRTIAFLESVARETMLTKVCLGMLKKLAIIEPPPLNRLHVIEIGNRAKSPRREHQNPITWNVLEIPFDQMAEHIFYTTIRLFKAMQPRECLSKDWKTSAGRFTAPRLHIMHHNMEALRTWVKMELYWCKDLREMASKAGYFLEMAKALARLGDLHDSFLVLQAIEVLNEDRFRVVWDWMETRHISVWNNLKDTNPRGVLQDVQADVIKDTSPTVARAGQRVSRKQQIPYYEPELVQFNDIVHHMPDYGSSGLINFEKRYLLYTTWSFISRAQARCIDPPEMIVDKKITSFLHRIPLSTREQLEYAKEHANLTPPSTISPAEQKRRRLEAKSAEDARDTLSTILLDIIENDRAFEVIIQRMLDDQLADEDSLVHKLQESTESMEQFDQLSALLSRVTVLRSASWLLAPEDWVVSEYAVELHHIIQDVGRAIFTDCDIVSIFLPSEEEIEGDIETETGYDLVLAVSDFCIFLVDSVHTLNLSYVKHLETITSMLLSDFGVVIPHVLVNSVDDEALERVKELEFQLTIL